MSFVYGPWVLRGFANTLVNARVKGRADSLVKLNSVVILLWKLL